MIYTNKPESFLENETHKLLWDFEIQTDHQIPARRPNDKKKKNMPNCRLYCPCRPQSGNQKNRKKRTKKSTECVSIDYINCYWCNWNHPIRELEELDIGGRADSIKTTELLRSARILRRVLKTCGDLLSLSLQ